MSENSENSQSNHPEREFLTATEVGLLWKVDAKTVRRWARDGKLPFVKLPSGRMRFRRSEILRASE